MRKILILAAAGLIGLSSCQESQAPFFETEQPIITETGWFELPEEVEKQGDYYYAHHLRNDASGQRNYSICYSAARHCAVWTAHIAHPSFAKNAGRNEQWQWDPLIPREVQPDLSASYKGNNTTTRGNYYSRGHMVASEDRQLSRNTNQQTFYYTNMAPQLQDGFNAGIWVKLEARTQGDYNCSDTLYVVTGSHWANNDRVCYDNSGKTVVVPTHFYKVLMRTKSGTTGQALSRLSAADIKCVAFWFTHDNTQGKTALAANHLISVAEAERRTGLTFFPNVPNAPKETFTAADWGL